MREKEIDRGKRLRIHRYPNALCNTDSVRVDFNGERKPGVPPFIFDSLGKQRCPHLFHPPVNEAYVKPRFVAATDKNRPPSSEIFLEPYQRRFPRVRELYGFLPSIPLDLPLIRFRAFAVFAAAPAKRGDEYRDT